MNFRPCCWQIILALCCAVAATGATFGTVVPLSGVASDLALDEARGLLYIANFTAGRIDVMSTTDLAIHRTIRVGPQPGSVALSRDGQFLVVTHFGSFQPPGTPFYAVTVIDISSDSRKTFPLSSAPLGVAFTKHGRALVVTTGEFLLFDPATGEFSLLGTVQEVTANTLPAPPADFPPEIIAASMAASADGLNIYGLTDTIRFRYDVVRGRVISLGYTAEPPLGPRVVSVSRDGSYYAAGWALFDSSGVLLAQFANPSGLLSVGSHAIDSSRGLLYAQIPKQAGDPPVLLVADADNLYVRERLRLPENLSGKSVLSADGAIMYSISASGVTVLPVGAYSAQRRLVLSAEELLFRLDFCRRDGASQEMWVEDPSGAATDFTISAAQPGITVTPSYGVTPARVEVRLDLEVFQNRTGTTEIFLDVQSGGAVNIPAALRVLVNVREPDQRGAVVHIPGKLVDLVADPARNRFYVLRQDRNELLAYDGTTLQRLATLRTGNTPTQMAITYNRHYLLVGNDNSQIANVYNLETLAAERPIRFPPGHYPRSLAASGRSLLAACRVVGPNHTIDRVDFVRRTAAELPSLGVWQNKIHPDTVLAPSPDGASILAVQPDGNLLLYDSNEDTFIIARKDFDELCGPYAASSRGRFVAGNHVLNSSLVPVAPLESGATPSSFAFVDDYGLLTTSTATAGPGVIRRVDFGTTASVRPTRMAEAPPPPTDSAPLRRTLAALLDRNALISLTTSGLTVLPWNYDAAVEPPRLQSVVNAADFTSPVAPGGLFAIFGQNLGIVTAAAQGGTLPTVLGESCLTANGEPLPLVFVSPAQINGQLPYQASGTVALVLHTPSGTSDGFQVNVLPAAPAVFRSGAAGPYANLPTVLRAANNQLATAANPIHRGDTIVIYLTGLGQTSPAVPEGVAAPLDPLARAAVTPQVSLGDVPLPVAYAGLTPTLAGVYQINAQVPHWTPSGMEVPLRVSQGSGATELKLRVVD